MSVDISDADRELYARELRAFLPARIFDAHIHLFDRACLVPGYQFPPRNCFSKFGGAFTLEQYLAGMAAMLPEQECHFNSFGLPSYDADLDASAAYSGRISDNRGRFAMALVCPSDTAAAVRRRVLENRLIGYKPYLDFVKGKSRNDVTIHDMLPTAQMAVAEELGLAIMLHIPRAERLADPVNQAQLVELCRRYPAVRIIVAHIGRAYYLDAVKGLLDGIAACPNAYVDTAMVNHEGVLEYTFRHFPRDRILFGSDAPIAFLRGKSVEINRQYAYLMAEAYDIGTSIYDARGAVSFTTFYNEQLRGMRLASERAGLTRAEIEDVFFNNASRLFRVAAARYGTE
ncbi:MAG: amidohydrolase [Lentisphaerae bacterium]|nr:amidohydrolase [Lentisphaerota bacterium]